MENWNVKSAGWLPITHGMNGPSHIDSVYPLPVQSITAPALDVPALGQHLHTAGKALWAVAVAGLAVWAWAHTWFLP